ncbi:MAG: iron-regulated membrane protein [Isosphaeraceae bacterium]|jgi:uncharacterized iron-regulated membrane protein|nr:MAG: iron-regulated membrane protein [Isosphaeraceae bacterium]
MKFTRRTFFLVHSFGGVTLGVMLYMLCFSGAVAVYKDELVLWANSPAAEHRESSQSTPVDIDALFKTLKARLPEREVPRRLTLPRGASGVFELRTRGGKRVWADASGLPVEGHSVALADFIVNLHTRIFLGHEGRWIVGIAGFGLLASMLSGLVIHRRLITKPFQQGAPLRLQLVAGHKFVGMVGLPGFLTLTLTGIWLGLYTLVAPRIEHLWSANPPGLEARLAEIPGVVPRAPGDLPLGAILDRAAELISGFEPIFVDWPPTDDRAAGTVDVRGNLPFSLVQRHRVGVDFRLADGSVKAIHAPGWMTAGKRVHDAMMPLHVGDWGAQGIKLLYFLFGLLASGLCLSGILAWADRRRRQPGLFGKASPWPWRLIVSSTGAGSLAILAMPVLARLGFQHDLNVRFLQLWALGTLVGLLGCVILGIRRRSRATSPQRPVQGRVNAGIAPGTGARAS